MPHNQCHIQIFETHKDPLADIFNCCVVYAPDFRCFFQAHLLHSVWQCIHFIFIRDNRRLLGFVCSLAEENFRCDFIPKFDLNLPTAVWVCRHNVNSECQTMCKNIVFYFFCFVKLVALFFFPKGFGWELGFSLFSDGSTGHFCK